MKAAISDSSSTMIQRSLREGKERERERERKVRGRKREGKVREKKKG